MQVAITVVRDGDGKFSVPYIGESCVGALAALANLPADSEGIVVRNPQPFKRKNAVRQRLTAATDVHPVTEQATKPQPQRSNRK